jgi:hypothetical protein
MILLILYLVGLLIAAADVHWFPRDIVPTRPKFHLA